MKNNNWKGESKKARNDTKWGKSTRHGERNTFQCLKAGKQFEKSTKEAETKRKNKFCNLYEIHNITPLTRILSVRKNTALLQFSRLQHRGACNSFSIGHILLYNLPGAAWEKMNRFAGLIL